MPARSLMVNIKVGDGIRGYFRLLKTPTLMLIILAQSIRSLHFNSLDSLWSGILYQHAWHGKDDARVTLGVIALVGGLAGTIVAGVLGDRLAKRTKGLMLS